MFKYTSLRDQIIEERNKNIVLKAQADKNASDIDYIAMMSDIELETDEQEEAEGDNDEHQV